MTFKEIMSVITNKSPIVFKKEIKECNIEELESILLICVGYQGIIPPEFLKERPEKEFRWLLGKIYKNINFYFNKKIDVEEMFEILYLMNGEYIESEIELLSLFKMGIEGKKSEIYLSLYHHLFIFFRIVLFIESTILFLDGKKDKIKKLVESHDKTNIYFLELIFYIMNIDGKLHRHEKKIFSQLISLVDKSFYHRVINIDKLLKNIKERSSKKELNIAYKIAYLTTLIDNKDDKREISLISIIREIWGISEEMHTQIILDITNDVSLYENILHKSKFEKFFKNFEKKVIKKVTKIVIENKDKILNELSQTKEMAELIAKRASGKTLTKEEDELVSSQLADVLKTIPALGIFALPGGTILLPILAKVLPFNILPSSFAKKEELKEKEISKMKEHLLCLGEEK